MRITLLIFLLGEIAYGMVVRLCIDLSHFSVETELRWCALRLVSVPLLGWLYRRTRAEIPGPATRITGASWLALGILLVPVLTADEGLPSPLRYVFSATSLLVGLREELAYRAVLQTQLTKRFGFAPSLVVTTLAFLAYHYGIGPFSFPHVVEIVFCGLIFGVTYHITRSLALVVTLHALYDAIWPLSPIVPWRLPYEAGAGIFFAVFVAVLIANRKTLRAPIS